MDSCKKRSQTSSFIFNTNNELSMGETSVNENDITLAKWAKGLLYLLLIIHVFILGYGIYLYVISAWSYPPGWGDVISAIFGVMFMMIGGIISLLLCLLVYMHHRIAKNNNPSTRTIKFTRIFQMIIMIIILSISVFWIMIIISNENASLLPLSLLTLFPSIYILIFSSKFPKSL